MEITERNFWGCLTGFCIGVIIMFVILLSYFTRNQAIDNYCLKKEFTLKECNEIKGIK